MFQNLQNFSILDKTSQAEIICLISTLDNTKITSNNIHLVLKFALRIILLDDSSVSVNFCWKLLDAIELLKLPLELWITPQFVNEILDDDIMQHCPESLKVIQWLLNNVNSKEIKMAVKEKVVEMVGPKGAPPQYTLDDLKKIIQKLNIMQQQPELMPQGTELEELCTNIVLSLGQFQMPADQANIAVFLNSVEDIKKFLLMVYKTYPQVMMMRMLSALYKSITEAKRDAGPGLAVVLQLIEPKFITEAVRWILAPKHDDASLVRGLNILVGWLFQWTRKPDLGGWVVAFMCGLRGQKRYNVLEQVTLDRIQKMFRMLVLSALRDSISTVLFHMLLSMQHSPVAFLIAADHFPHTIELLRKENSPSSLACIQKIVDVSSALMEHFPKFENQYEKLRKAIEDEKPSEDYRDVLIKTPSWCDAAEMEQPIIITQNVPGKVGLNNLGNTCYMNSVLQALFMTMSFRNEILTYPSHVRPIDGLQTLFTLLQFSKRSAIQPPDTFLSVRPPGFLPGLQHDSSEYMGYLLDIIHEQEKARLGSSIDQPGSSTTIVQHTFGGQAITTNRCHTCLGESVQTDSFRDIQLSFPICNSPAANRSDSNSVQALLEFYLQPEQLCGENRYWCDRCGALSNAERSLQVTQTPRHLILTLKHFRYDPKSQQRAKLFQRVRYDPVIELNSSRYNLCAAVVHSGPSVDSGHYYTFARDNLSTWYKFNDSWVSRSSMAELSSLQQPSTPYVLFYQRQDINTPSPLSMENLSPVLQNAVKRDLAAFAAENRSVHNQRSASPILRRKSDEDEDPPPGCGGGGGDFNENNASRFVY